MGDVERQRFRLTPGRGLGRWCEERDEERDGARHGEDALPGSAHLGAMGSRV